MRRAETPTWVGADEVKSAARRVGLDRLQQYLDHLTETRAYDWFEARPLTRAEKSRLAWLVGEENLDRYEQFTTELTHRKAMPLRGDNLDEYPTTAERMALVNAMPFVRWYHEERRRLRRDAQLLANRAKQRESIAAATLKHAQTAYVAWKNYISNGALPDWQEDRARWSQYYRIEDLRTAAAAERRAAKWASNKAASIRSAADRLGGVKSHDLAVLSIALDAFICREFSSVLSSVDSVTMLFLTWVDAESISCAGPKCSQRFLHTSAHRRRPQEYCSSACKMAAYRTREESVQVA